MRQSSEIITAIATILSLMMRLLFSHKKLSSYIFKRSADRYRGERNTSLIFNKTPTDAYSPRRASISVHHSICTHHAICGSTFPTCLLFSWFLRKKCIIIWQAPVAARQSGTRVMHATCDGSFFVSVPDSAAGASVLSEESDCDERGEFYPLARSTATRFELAWKWSCH